MLQIVINAQNSIFQRGYNVLLFVSIRKTLKLANNEHFKMILYTQLHYCNL